MNQKICIFSNIITWLLIMGMKPNPKTSSPKLEHCKYAPRQIVISHRIVDFLFIKLAYEQFSYLQYCLR